MTDPGPALAAFSIDPRDGAIVIGDVRLAAGESRRAAERKLGDWLVNVLDHRNGYVWLNLDGLSFGGHPAGIGLCFHNGRLAEASWGVILPSAAADSWPTPEEIEEEIAFVRSVLVREIGFPAKGDAMTLPWGDVWTVYDRKADIAANGLRYR